MDDDAVVDERLGTHLAFDPDGDFDGFLRAAPAKGAVYRLADEQGRTIQLLSVGNLRASLKRRLGGDGADEGPTKRVDYRKLVRHIDFARVDSAFEADAFYHAEARRLYPDTYRARVGFHPAWFIHVDPDAAFPRYTVTQRLDAPGRFFGPFDDRRAASKLIERVEDAFDLCRFFNVLGQSPDGLACAYKQMHRCPAPCDGSVSMESYRRMVAWSADTLADPSPRLADLTDRMKSAAADLHFELAGRIKALIDDLGEWRKGPSRHVRELDDFRYLAIQRGPTELRNKFFLIGPGRIELIACAIRAVERPAELLRTIWRANGEAASAPLDDLAAERIGIAARHLLAPKGRQGVFIHLSELEEGSFARGCAELRKQKVVEASDTEGMVKELESPRP